MNGRASDSSPMETLAGLVERVTFHNAENGFCVLRVKVRGQRDLVTVVGHAAMISAGEFVQMSGRWFNDHTHGLQFKAEFLKAVLSIGMAFPSSSRSQPRRDIDAAPCS
ncbi:hypothetical protein AME01nite_29690 [Acidomonas methanolica NBRC 104435]|nr:hypothetical protein EDC31_14012 [Acidomonas methanolica]GEL00471.1 hypothetical protein AME01nite_29690 [Acidomonas methanolica NBRC 104435]